MATESFQYGDGAGVTEQEPDFTADTFDSDGKEICRDWTRNVCNKGNRCKFAHPPHKITDLLEKSSICHDYQNPKGCSRPKCRYIHVTKDEEDYIRATGDVPASFTEEQVQAIKGSKPVCNDYMKGRCDRGDKCKFRHPPEVMGGGPMPPGPGPMSGPHGGPQRFEPYPRHPPGLDHRMEMRRQYREDMMEDEIMYLRAQVSRLKRQVADLTVANESLMEENAKLRHRPGSLAAMKSDPYSTPSSLYSAATSATVYRPGSLY